MMRSQQKYGKLRSLAELPKPQKMNFNPEFDFSIRQTLQTQSLSKKMDATKIHCRTEESSPMNSRVEQKVPLPQLQFTKSSRHLAHSKESQVLGSRAVDFLDSLIGILLLSRNPEAR